jgi:hypothetical protein
MQIHILKFTSLHRYRQPQNDQGFHLNAADKQYFCVQNQEN